MNDKCAYIPGIMDPNGNTNGGKRGFEKLREIMLRNKEESEVSMHLNYYLTKLLVCLDIVFFLACSTGFFSLTCDINLKTL